MKKTLLLLMFAGLYTTMLQAQNIFPATGRAGIYTNSPTASLQVNGGAKIGRGANNAIIDSATGNLSFAGNAQYRVAGNRYAFAFDGNPNYGLFFNQTNVRYEFRNNVASPVFYIDANAGAAYITPLTTANKKVVFYDATGNNNEYYGFGVNDDILRYQVSTQNGSHVFYAATSPTISKELMRITGAGYVGIGKANPHALLQLSDTLLNRKIVMYESGDNEHQFYGLGVNANTFRYQVDATTADHVFYAAASPTTSNELMRIAGTGNVSIGSANTANYRLRIKQDSYGLAIETSSSSDTWELYTSSGGFNLFANNNLVGVFNKTSGAYAAVSDERLKTNIKEMPVLLDKINQLKPVSYQFKNAAADSKNSLGFLAQDVKEVFPELVTHVVDKQRGTEQFLMDYSGFGVIAVKGIQELQKVLQAKDEKLAVQQMQMDELKAMMEKMQQTLSTLQSCSPCGANTLMNSTSTDIKIETKQPAAATLEQNKPNPFNNQTSISYTLPAGFKKAQLLITDASGKSIRQIPLVQAGKGMINIDASSLNSGTYYYTLIVDGKKADSKKMVTAK